MRPARVMTYSPSLESHQWAAACRPRLDDADWSLGLTIDGSGQAGPHDCNFARIVTSMEIKRSVIAHSGNVTSRVSRARIKSSNMPTTPISKIAVIRLVGHGIEAGADHAA